MTMKNLFARTLPSYLLLALMAGCSAAVPPEVTVPAERITTLRSREHAAEWPDDLGISIQPLADSRSPSAVGLIGGKTTMASGDASIAVRQVLEEYLRDEGVSLSAKDGPSIGGEVVEWYAAVRNGFPTSVAQAHAALHLRVFDPHQQVVYFATYRGEASHNYLSVSRSDVEEVLASAMDRAVEEVLADPRLVAAIRRAG